METVTFGQFLMPVITWISGKTNRFRENFKCWFRSKNDPFPHFEHYMSFPWKSKTITFLKNYQYLSSGTISKKKKKIGNRFREKLKSVDFGPQMTHLPHIFLRWFCHFYVCLNLTNKITCQFLLTKIVITVMVSHVRELTTWINDH